MQGKGTKKHFAAIISISFQISIERTINLRYKDIIFKPNTRSHKVPINFIHKWIYNRVSRAQHVNRKDWGSATVMAVAVVVGAVVIVGVGVAGAVVCLAWLNDAVSFTILL